MPIPADQKPASYRVELLDEKGAVLSSSAVGVIDSHFRKQNVVIEQNVAELQPSPGESESAMSFRQEVSEVRYWSEPLAAPVRGCMTSPYGVQRYLNGKPTGNIHAGLDLRAPTGTPVRAVADGAVKIVREWNLHGHTIGIDHGQGSRIDVPAFVSLRGSGRSNREKGGCDRLFGNDRAVQRSASALDAVRQRRARESAGVGKGCIVLRGSKQNSPETVTLEAGTVPQQYRRHRRVESNVLLAG